jgi:hypothetical protein
MDLFEKKMALKVAKLEAEREMEEWKNRNWQFYREAEIVYQDAIKQLSRLENVGE